jgi:hypothetical protein
MADGAGEHRPPCWWWYSTVEQCLSPLFTLPRRAAGCSPLSISTILALSSLDLSISCNPNRNAAIVLHVSVSYR